MTQTPQTQVLDDVASRLQETLSGTFTLYLDTHMAHWNVRGPDFPHLHAFFETQYTELWQAVDMLAERMRGLGHSVPREAVTGGPRHDGRDARLSVKSLAEGHRNLGAQFADLQQAATHAGDEVTSDIAVERMRAHEKFAWMLEAVTEDRTT